MELKLVYYASCDLKEKFKDKTLLPYIQVYVCNVFYNKFRLNLTGFKPDEFKFIKGKYNPLACYGEVRLAYCITRIFPYIRERRFGPWGETRPTRNMYSDPVIFNEGIELPLPYSCLYDYSGICLILCSTYTDSDGVHDQYIAGCHLFLYNSKKYISFFTSVNLLECFAAPSTI